MTEYRIKLSLHEICYDLQISEGVCVELVEYGIVEPEGRQPADWLFDLNMHRLVKRALRLHRDLDLDWSDVAMISRLLDERDRLRAENRLLQRQLQRFISD